MIQSIKFTSLSWHSGEKPGSKEDLKTKTRVPPPIRVSFEETLITKTKTGLFRGSMAPLLVTLSIFIKGLPLVYPGRALMAAGRGVEDHAVTFPVLKKAYCPAGPAPKGCRRSVQIGGGGPIHLYVMENMERLWWRRSPEGMYDVYWYCSPPSICCFLPLPLPNQNPAVFSQT